MAHAFGNFEGAREQPRRAAVERSTGNVFVVEERNGRVLVFKSSGLGLSLLTQFGGDVLESPYGIAIDDSGSATEIYVSDAGTNSIVRFESDGAATPSFSTDDSYTSPAQGTEDAQVESFASPLALAPDGDLWVADRGANVVKRFDDTGAHVAGSNFDGSTSPDGAFTGLLDIAANSTGDLYVVDTTGEISNSEGTSRVERFAADGGHKATIGPLGPESRSAIVAIDPSDDSIVVSGDQDGIGRLIFAPPVYLFDSTNNFVEEFNVSPGVQGGSFRGMVIVPGLRNTLHFSIGPNFYNGNETAGVAGVFTMSEAIAPTVTIEPAAEITATGATIEGTINPHGVPAEWVAEFRRAGSTEWEVVAMRDLELSTSPEPVSEQLEGLLPGEEYAARLRAISVDGESESSIETFTTDAAAPRILGQSAQTGGDSATLRARINPSGSATTYFFEYGTTDAYGQSTPAGTIAAGNAGVNVAAEVDGLTPGTTYHFRVVANSDEGDAAGGDQTFTTQGAADHCANAEYRTGPAAQLSDCRAYELVTPAGSKADIRMAGAPVTPDGTVACFNSENILGSAGPNGIKLADDGHCAYRGSDGWETKWVTGPEPKEKFGALGGNVYFLSPDGKRAVFASDEFLLGPDYKPMPPATAGPVMRSYMWEDGETRSLTPAEPPLVIPGLGEIYFPEAASNVIDKRAVAASEDLTRGLFHSTRKLVPEDKNSTSDVYEWNPDGVRVVSTADSSTAAAGGTAPIANSYQTMGVGMVSGDGSRLFFHHKGVPLDAERNTPAEAPTGVQNVYLREGDELTLVTPRGAGVPADRNFRFVAASVDGETVYVESTTSGNDLGQGIEIFVYDVSAGELELFASRPGGTEALGVSEDGSTVVFRSLGTYQVFVARGGQSTLLGTLAANERGVNQETDLPYRLGSRRPDQRTLRFTPDGSAFTFTSAGEFGASGSGVVQVYRWSEEDGLQNISAVGDDEPTRNATIGAYGGMEPGDPREEFLHNHRFKPIEGTVISEDGSRVLFETPEALVARDVNGVTDVYEWHEGTVDLVTPGTGRSKALYHGSSADGKTVFFTTFDSFDPRDSNNMRDVYVAQPGGGFPPPPAPPACQGEGCQADRITPPAGRPGSHGVSDGNIVAAPKATLRAGQLKQLANKGRTTIKVAVAAPGKVTVLLKGKVKGRNATVAKASKSAQQAGTLKLPLKLSKPARKQLEQKGKLRLKLEIRHSRAEKSTRKAVMLRG